MLVFYCRDKERVGGEAFNGVVVVYDAMELVVLGTVGELLFHLVTLHHNGVLEAQVVFVVELRDEVWLVPTVGYGVLAFGIDGGIATEHPVHQVACAAFVHH